MNGGYDEGYENCPCLWGREPGSLVTAFLQANPSQTNKEVFDLGCGEGKNAAAFAKAGAHVVATDCSSRALVNGKAAWPELAIEWLEADATLFAETLQTGFADIVVLYGLLHCLPSDAAIRYTIEHCKRATRPGGYHIVVAFNDGPHDLSAHPGFNPTLMSHSYFIALYPDWKLETATDSVLHEAHPNNNIPHFHSLTRLVARKP